VPQGVPRTTETRVPSWPEEAVLEVFRVTGARTREVPVLFQPGERWIPQGARWRLILDRPILVEVATDGTRLSTDTVFIGVWTGPAEDGGLRYGLQWYVSAAIQPTEEVIQYSVGTPGNLEARQHVAKFRPEVPVHFDFVFPVR
jgi:hypothetical protein